MRVSVRIMSKTISVRCSGNNWDKQNVEGQKCNISQKMQFYLMSNVNCVRSELRFAQFIK